MLLHDRVTITTETETGETDAAGRPIVETVEHRLPAQVDPTTTTDGKPDSEQLISRYKVMVKAPDDLSLMQVQQVGWRGWTLRVDGRIQPQMLRGRIHHYEFTSQRVTG